MKITTITILIILFFAISTYADPNDTNQIEIHRMGAPETIKTEEHVKVENENKKLLKKDANAPAQGIKKDVNDVGSINDTNDTLSDEFRDDWKNIDKEGKDETGYWLRSFNNETMGLIRSTHNSSEAELILLRKIALKENANDTVAAIDKVMAKRNKRYEDVLKKLEREKQKAKEEERTRQRPERQQRTRLTPEERRRLKEERMKRRRTRERNVPVNPEY